MNPDPEMCEECGKYPSWQDRLCIICAPASKIRQCIRCKECKPTRLYVHEQQQKQYDNVLPLPWCKECAKAEQSELALA